MDSQKRDLANSTANNPTLLEMKFTLNINRIIEEIADSGKTVDVRAEELCEGEVINIKRVVATKRVKISQKKYHKQTKNKQKTFLNRTFGDISQHKCQRINCWKLIQT